MRAVLCRPVGRISKLEGPDHTLCTILAKNWGGPGPPGPYPTYSPVVIPFGDMFFFVKFLLKTSSSLGSFQVPNKNRYTFENEIFLDFSFMSTKMYHQLVIKKHCYSLHDVSFEAIFMHFLLNSKFIISKI